MSKKEKFKELLKNIFQYSKDKIELDFGVYRVFKHKEDEIQSFIETKLPEFIEKNLEKLEPITIYIHTLEFFERYFQDGDFYPVPIYATTKNHILRHNGEEVIFSWANKDQYYIKSIDNFSIYKIKHDNLYNDAFYNTKTQAVNFVVNEIDDTKGNNKSTRIFTLSTKSANFVENEGFNIYLDYKNKSNELVEIDENKLYEITQNAKINLTLEDVAHHLKKFKNLRKTDFFIHKRLESFLKEELDYYLKTNILRDITTLSEVDIKTIQVVKKVCEFIIKFIASLEELQKMLWEKKKFAYDVNYIITLDKLPKELLEEIIVHPNFTNQIDEWKELKLIKEFKKDELYDGLLSELKKEYKYLPLDTKHFEDEELKYKILESIENLDDAIDGVLINSDNFHGLNFLQNRYREKVKCVYIDPPYNTGDDGFAYKDNYQHSSWLSMIKDRIQLTSNFLNESSLLYVQIDDNENHNLDMLFNNEISYEQLIEMYIQTRYAEKTLVEDMDFQKLIENIKVYRQSSKAKLIKETTEYVYDKFEWEIKTLGEPLKVLDLGGKKVEVYQKGNYEIVKKKPSNLLLKEIWASGKILSGNSSGRFFRDYLQGREHEDNLETLYKVYDIGGDIYDYRYFTGPKQVGKTKGKYYQGVPIDKMKESIKELIVNNYFNYSDAFGNCRLEGGVELRSGKKPEILLKKVLEFTMNDDDIYSYVLDFFAGSGTTSAVAHKMNKKYLAIEMGEYFDNLTLKRIKNVLAGDKTGISKEVQYHGGGIVKYYRLEQYEDTLENSQLQSTTDTNSYIKALEPLKEHMNELYASKYLTLYKDFISRESKALLMDDTIFFNPFDFSLRVNIDSQIVEKKMDLVETFNTLKGIEVRGMKLRYLDEKKYVFVDGKNEVVIWREFDKNSLDITKELDFIKENCDTSKELYINGITQTHTKKELVAKESVFELRALLVEGVKIDE